jgi:hypothetical protein
MELPVAEYSLLSCKRCPGEEGLAMMESAGIIGDKPHFHLKVHTGRYTHSLTPISLLAGRAILGVHLTPKCEWQMKVSTSTRSRRAEKGSAGRSRPDAVTRHHIYHHTKHFCLDDRVAIHIILLSL